MRLSLALEKEFVFFSFNIIFEQDFDENTFTFNIICVFGV
jgi:hypothetical protein